MTIGFLDREAVLKKVADDVCDKEYGCSWNLGTPPCFDANGTLDLIKRELLTRAGVVVADMTTDTSNGCESYVRRLFEQWSSQVQLQPLRNVPADAMFDYLIASLPENFLFVQVIRQFHKVPEVLGVPFLGQLRDAEQRRSIKTITATPLLIPDLKKRWGRLHPCTVSGYGDGHAEMYVKPLCPDAVVQYLEEQGIPKGISQYLSAQTGGYPECIDATIRVVKRANVTSLTPALKGQLKSAAVNLLRRFVEYLDEESQTIYRDAVVDIYHGVEIDTAVERCHMHPWAEILLNEETELRAGYLGEAAIQDEIRDAASDDKSTLTQDHFTRAFRLYRMRKFVDAGRVFNAISGNRPDLEVTKANATLMQCLYSVDAPGEDSDWAGVVAAARKAQLALSQSEGLTKMASYLSGRLETIERIGSNIVALQRKNEKRVVDLLAGLRPSNQRCDETAAFLLLCKFETCNAISGHAAACQASLALPEQLLRVWAYWALSINYYSTPENVEEIWKAAESEWPSSLGPLKRSEPGKQFVSLTAFGYFVLAAALLNDVQRDKIPVDNFSELRSVFTRYDQLRNPQAHSYCFTTRKEREQFFALAERWLISMLTVCPSGSTRNDLLDLLEPLPLIGRDGAVL